MAIFSKKKSDSDKPTAEKEEKVAEKKSAETSKTAAPGAMDKVPTILLQPRISEKASHLVKLNKYIFNVAKAANKVEVKKAVEKAYKVKVIMVNILNTKGKQKSYGRISGKTSSFKKAVITLREGDKIEGVTEIV